MSQVRQNAKNQPHDINKLPTDGYLVFPLSMSRLQGGQSPEACYAALDYFAGKVLEIGIDVVFLYTNGLYYNNDESALVVRKRTNSQMLQHRNGLNTLVMKAKKYVPQAMHFLPWDYVVLNSPRFTEFSALLTKLRGTDSEFERLLEEGLAGREKTEANVNFLIEEIVVSHIIRQGMIDFPKTLVQKDNFRLIMYPGSYFQADLYQWKKGILPRNNESKNPYGGAHYDLTKHLLYKFDEESVN
jgi:hypothetical protein